MTALELAAAMGVDPKEAAEYLGSCDEVIEGSGFVATRRGNRVHLAIRVKGLGGRRVLKQCRDVLARWFLSNPVLLAPVKHGNDAAIAVAEALGFARYATTATHVWLAKERGHE